MALFRAAARAEFSINGFRNRDLQALLYEGAPDSLQEMFHPRAGAARQVVQGYYHVKAKRIVERADRDVKIDGEKINPG